jgi:hypothetical protein
VNRLNRISEIENKKSVFDPLLSTQKLKSNLIDRYNKQSPLQSGSP